MSETGLEGANVATQWREAERASQSDVDLGPLNRRKAMFHRRHRRAAMRDWMIVLAFLLLVTWLATVAVVAVFAHQ